MTCDLIQPFLLLSIRFSFLGGIVRLAAHDFMDFDQNSVTAGGMDGCIDFAHPSNHGLPEDVWCDDCLLTEVFENYSDVMSRADFWVAAAHAVIRLSSSNAL